MLPHPEATANVADAVNFTWVPNHVGGVVDYELRVFEVPEYSGFSDDILIRTLAPVGTARVVGGATQYGWTVYDARLEPGRTYLYDVRAVDPLGRMPLPQRGLLAAAALPLRAVARPDRPGLLPAGEPDLGDEP